MAATTIAEIEEMDRDAIATIAGKWFLIMIATTAKEKSSAIAAIAAIQTIIRKLDHFPAIVAIASLSLSYLSAIVVAAIAGKCVVHLSVYVNICILSLGIRPLHISH